MTGEDFYHAVAEVLRNARTTAYRAANFAMVEAYWQVGRMIVEEDQQGERRAEYGAHLLENLAGRLMTEFGPGFDQRELRRMRQFYTAFPIRDALRPELSWTHYRSLIRVRSQQAREWYMSEAVEENWSTRALERQINTLYFERMLLTTDRRALRREARKKTAPLAPSELIKDPYVLEFLGIPDPLKFRESELEQAIIDKLQAFMLELGRGFAFVGRQQRISTNTKDFYVDLVFYNYLLKCFVLIDLKTGELTHQDIGQMDMYVRMYEDKMRGAEDNPTVGLILCTRKDSAIARYSVLQDSEQLFASQYRLYLPSEEELVREIEQQRDDGVRERDTSYSRPVALLRQSRRIAEEMAARAVL